MGDWVFASPDMDGKQPYWPETPLKCYVQPAAKRVGITKALGWHSFRRTFATLLKGGGEDVKTAGTDAARKEQIDAGRVRTGSDPS